MLFRRTGDIIEKSDKINRVMNVFIIALVVALVWRGAGLWYRFDKRVNEPVEIDDIERIERLVHSDYSGPSAGLDIWGNPYPFGEGSRYSERWAVSEWYAERVLMGAYEAAGDKERFEAAKARAEDWAAKAGSLVGELDDIEDMLR